MLSGKVWIVNHFNRCNEVNRCIWVALTQAINACSKALQWKESLQLLKHMTAQEATFQKLSWGFWFEYLLTYSYNFIWYLVKSPNHAFMRIMTSSQWQAEGDDVTEGFNVEQMYTRQMMPDVYQMYSRFSSARVRAQVRANCISYSSCISSCEWRLSFYLLHQMTSTWISPNDFIFNTARVSFVFFGFHPGLDFTCDHVDWGHDILQQVHWMGPCFAHYSEHGQFWGTSSCLPAPAT